MAYYKRYRKVQNQLKELLSSSDTSEDEGNPCSKLTKQDDNIALCEEIDTSFPLPCEQQMDNIVSSSSSEESDNDNKSTQEELAEWAVENNITRQALNQLLDILRRKGLHLPKDGRTLLQTPRHVTVEDKCGGKYAYYGIASTLKLMLHDNEEFVKNNDAIELNVNVDGIPLYKSSNDQFWPILLKFSYFRPALVALYCGKVKPNSVDSFLSDFLEEYQQLLQDGFVIDEKRLDVKIISFICDAPARSFLKCIKGHAGYYACERCEIKGTWDSHVLILNSSSKCKERTDDLFNEGHYEGTHQLGRSSLIQYGISCVKGFPLDYMHLICLGVTRRMLLFLIRGSKMSKLSQHQIGLLSSILEGMSLPSEFARQPRSLTMIDRWKATEFRQYILYTSIVALKDIVSPAMYTTSLSLTVALSILLNSNNGLRNAYLSYARELLEYFVQQCSEVFGRHFVVYNVHNVLHLADDVEHYQCSLNSLSAFPFENHLQAIKKLVRSSTNPIAQVFKRLFEKEKHSRNKDRLRQPCISTTYKDNCFILENEDFVFLKEKKSNNYYLCDVLSHDLTENFFTSPCDSKLINVVFMKSSSKTKEKIIHSKHFSRKVVKLPYKDGVVLLPVLHNVNE